MVYIYIYIYICDSSDICPFFNLIVYILHSTNIHHGWMKIKVRGRAYVPVFQDVSRTHTQTRVTLAPPPPPPHPYFAV